MKPRRDNSIERDTLEPHFPIWRPLTRHRRQCLVQTEAFSTEIYSAIDARNSIRPVVSPAFRAVNDVKTVSMRSKIAEIRFKKRPECINFRCPER